MDAAAYPDSKLITAQVRDNVAIHVPCTSKKLGVTGAFEQIAALCAKEVTPSGIPCCGKPPLYPSFPDHGRLSISGFAGAAPNRK